MEIRSYRTVFDLERRVYSIDSLRLNPTGVPVRGIAYFLALLVLLLLAGRLPLLGGLLAALPWYVVDLLAPGVGAALLGLVRLEGRTFHLAALALVRHGLGPRRLHGLDRRRAPGARWWAPELLMLPDGSDGRLRELRYSGPGAVLIARDHDRVQHARAWLRLSRRAALTVREAPSARPSSDGRVVVLAEGAKMRVSGRRAAGGAAR